MFSHVDNVGGRADCQNNPDTFRIMRQSQFETYDDALLQSYLDDLKCAKANGRNLMTEKYARMMQETYPEEYALLAENLPPVSHECHAMIEEILSVHRKWQKEVCEKYPCLLAHTRPAETGQNEHGQTSMETYLRGELETYSQKTLSLYHKRTLLNMQKGENEIAANLLNQMRQYGFSSLEECEKKLSQRHVQ